MFGITNNLLFFTMNTTIYRPIYRHWNFSFLFDIFVNFLRNNAWNFVRKKGVIIAMQRWYVHVYISNHWPSAKAAPYVGCGTRSEYGVDQSADVCALRMSLEWVFVFMHVYMLTKPKMDTLFFLWSEIGENNARRIFFLWPWISRGCVWPTRDRQHPLCVGATEACK